MKWKIVSEGLWVEFEEGDRIGEAMKRVVDELSIDMFKGWRTFVTAMKNLPVVEPFSVVFPWRYDRSKIDI